MKEVVVVVGRVMVAVSTVVVTSTVLVGMRRQEQALEICDAGDGEGVTWGKRHDGGGSAGTGDGHVSNGSLPSMPLRRTGATDGIR